MSKKTKTKTPKEEPKTTEFRAGKFDDGYLEEIYQLCRKLGWFVPKNIVETRANFIRGAKTYMEDVTRMFPQELVADLKAHEQETGQAVADLLADTLRRKKAATKSAGNRLAEFDGMTSKEMGRSLIGRQVQGAPVLRAETAAKEMMNINETAKEWWEKTFISASSIKQYLEAQADENGLGGAVNFAALQKVVGSKTAEGTMGKAIAEHNQKMGLDETHNRKAGAEKRRRSLEEAKN